MFDVYTIADFLSEEERVRVVGELRRASAVEATVSGRGTAYAVDSRARRTKALAPGAATRALLAGKLLARQSELERHFALGADECEEPQFLRYDTGDFFVAHQDGNTPLTRDVTLQRRISVVVFLSERDAYAGGALVLHGRHPDYDLRHTVDPRPGSLIAFRSETTHEVTPVTSGERYTVVSWFRVA